MRWIAFAAFVTTFFTTWVSSCGTLAADTLRGRVRTRSVSRVAVSSIPAPSRFELVVPQVPQAASVPVNPFANAFYTLQGLGAYQSSMALSEAQLDRLADKVVQKLNTVQTAEAVTNPLTMQHCQSCHSGDKPKGKFSVGGLLDATTRLKMISRLVHVDATKRMPKNQLLPALAIGALIQELSDYENMDVMSGMDAAPEPPQAPEPENIELETQDVEPDTEPKGAQ
jgi:hypothetical protein